MKYFVQFEVRHCVCLFCYLDVFPRQTDVKLAISLHIFIAFYSFLTIPLHNPIILNSLSFFKHQFNLSQVTCSLLFCSFIPLFVRLFLFFSLTYINAFNSRSAGLLKNLVFLSGDRVRARVTTAELRKRGKRQGQRRKRFQWPTGNLTHLSIFSSQDDRVRERFPYAGSCFRWRPLLIVSCLTHSSAHIWKV